MSLEIRRLRGLPLFLALWTAGFLLLSPVTGKAQESSGTADETSQEDTGADAAESAGDEADTAETGTIPENIFISGQNVSGMTADEANQVVADYLSGYGDVEFTLQAGGEERHGGRGGYRPDSQERRRGNPRAELRQRGQSGIQIQGQ